MHSPSLLRRARLLSLAFVPALVLPAASGQAVVNAYGVVKSISHVQVDAGAPTIGPTLGNAAGAYAFEVDVSGSNLDQLVPTPSVSLPDSTTYQLLQNGANSYSFLGNNPVPHRFATKPELDTAFPNGEYSMNIGGTVVPLSFGANDAYPADVPRITNGTWSGGRLLLDAAAGATIDFSAFGGYAAGGAITFILQQDLGGNPGAQLDYVSTSSLQTAAQTSYTVAAHQLTAGQNYYGRLIFSALVDVDLAAVPGAAGYAIHQYDTGFAITAVPEPAHAVAATALLTLAAAARRRCRSDRQAPGHRPVHFGATPPS